MEFMDPSLDDYLSWCKLIRCLQVGLLCVQEKWEDRPSMLEVESMLKNETALPAPKMPAFSRKFDHSQQSNFSHCEEDCCSINVGTTSQLMPR
nr:probable LRR receptor-like serine/threonine-protein kinase RFK1 [Ipomoea trifida]GMD25959.1 putative cysteine-rich receptor-like protein kinase 35 [Ipomoea batatas]